MAFTEKVLAFTFSGAAPFPGSPSGSFTVQGLRAIASIQAFDGPLGVHAQVKIWGLSMGQMDAYSTKIPGAIGGAGAVGVTPDTLTIEAGDLGSSLVKVIDGAPILASFIDLSDSPESSFNVTVAAVYLAAAPIAAQSQPGEQDAAQRIASLCAAAPPPGLTLNNPSGATGTLRNPSTYGSVVDQIRKIADAAGLRWKIEGSNVWLWPPNGTPDDVTLNVGPGTTPRMIGYPEYWPLGIIVRSLFNPQATVGRLVNVVGSTIPKANGVWASVSGLQHDLSTMLDRGPWFTTMVLSPPGVGAGT